MKTKTLLLTTLFTSLLTTTLLASRAEAAYFRFWQGYAKPGISGAAFQQGLNTGLFPATGALTRTAARLEAYQPVILTPALIRAGYPTEVALLSYESEAGYTAYRATPEGKAYGDLHWLYFNKDTSKSVVPEIYQGVIELGHAYMTGATGIDWSRGYANFRVYSREAGNSDRTYADSVRSHIDHLWRSRVADLVILVTPYYVMEYTLWRSSADQARADATTTVHAGGRGGRDQIVDELVEVTSRMTMNAPLPIATSARFGTGIRYRVR